MLVKDPSDLKQTKLTSPLKRLCRW